MAKQSGLNMRLYLGGFDISGDVGAVNTLRMSRAVQDVTGLDKLAVERLPLLMDGEIAFNVFMNAASDQEHEVLSAFPTTDQLAMLLFGTTRGDAVVHVNGKQMNYDWQRGADGALLGTVQILSSGYPLESGILLVAKTTHASATDETAHDGSAQSTSGGVGFLQHFSAASGTVEYDIEDSSDNVSFANLLAFSDVATPYAPIAQRVEVNGTVEQYVRASTNGTFTNAVFSMAFRRRAAEDFDAA